MKYAYNFHKFKKQEGDDDKTKDKMRLKRKRVAKSRIKYSKLSCFKYLGSNTSEDGRPISDLKLGVKYQTLY